MLVVIIGGGKHPLESEDCLNLNVITREHSFQKWSNPASRNCQTARPRASLAPVVVWIYGGSNVVGSVSSYGSIENIVRDSS
eukprot:920752-Amphidinium_carterae.1